MYYKRTNSINLDISLSSPGQGIPSSSEWHERLLLHDNRGSSSRRSGSIDILRRIRNRRSRVRSGRVGSRTTREGIAGSYTAERDGRGVGGSLFSGGTGRWTEILESEEEVAEGEIERGGDLSTANLNVGGDDSSLTVRKGQLCS